jgi:hypothetical protein
MTPAEFAVKWTGSTASERAAAQEHFIDLCRMLGCSPPDEADATGADYAFEKGVEKVDGELRRLDEAAVVEAWELGAEHLLRPLAVERCDIRCEVRASKSRSIPSLG